MNTKHANIVGLFLFLVFTLANLKNIESNNIFILINKLILWGGGAYVAIKYFLSTLIYKVSLSVEFLLYGSLIIFSLFGLYKVVSFPDYFRYLQVIISNLILMIIIYRVAIDRKNLLIILKFLWAAFLLSSIYSLFLEFSDMSTLYFRLRGITGNANGTANLARLSILVSVLILNLEKNVKGQYYLLFYGSLIISFIIIFLTASRGAFINLLFISTALSFNYYYFSKNKLRILSIFGIFVIFGAGLLVAELQKTYLYERLTKNESLEATIENDTRGELYMMAMDATIENPIVGVGLNQFRYYSGGKISHTDILDISSQLGIFAAISYAFIYIILYYKISIYWRFVNILFSKKVSFIFLVFLSSEVFYGFTNPNWFTQAQISILALIVAFYSQVVLNEYYTYKQKVVWK